MYAAEQILQALTHDELYYTLRSMVDEDCYLDECLGNSVLEDFLYLLEVYDIIFIASDDRLLLTPKGDKILQYLDTTICLNKHIKK